MNDLMPLIPGALVEMGKIKIGTLDPSKPFPGVKLDQFLITTMDRDQREVLIPDHDLMNALAEYRDKDDKRRLRTIPIMFHSHVIADVLSIRFEWWPGKSRIGATTTNLVVGDGCTDRDQLKVTFFCDHTKWANGAVVLPEPKSVPWSEDLLDLRSPDPKQSGKPVLTLSTTLSVSIANVNARFGGVYRFRTKGWHSTNQLLSSLQFAKRLTCGVLRGPVFKLKVQPKTVRPNGQVGTAQVVHVEPATSDLLQLREQARASMLYEHENLAMLREQEQGYKALPPAKDDDRDDEPLGPAETQLPEGRKTAADRQLEAMEEIENAMLDATDEGKLLVFWKSDRFTKELWPLLDADQKQAVLTTKDRRKESLKVALPPDDVQDGEIVSEKKPAELPKGESPKGTKAGKDIVATIEKLVVEKAGSWADFRSKHNIGATRVKDLSADEALAVLAQLRGESAGAA